MHEKARTTPYNRALIAQRVQAGKRPAAVARSTGVCARTVKKWVARHAEGDSRWRTGPGGRTTRRARSAALWSLKSRAGGGGIAGPRAAIAAGRQAEADDGGLDASPARARPAERAGAPRPPCAMSGRARGIWVHLDIKKLGRIAGIGHRMTGDRPDTTWRKTLFREWVYAARYVASATDSCSHLLSASVQLASRACSAPQVAAQSAESPPRTIS